MKNGDNVYRGICPICGKNYIGYPALSRTDNKTLICPECGQRQALESIGITNKEEQDVIIGLSRPLV